MSVPILPPGSQLLFSDHLIAGSYQLVGCLSEQYNENIGIYIANNDPYSTTMVQVVLTSGPTPSSPAIFNKSMYIPARNMGKIENLSNMGGINVFSKTPGTYITVFVVYNPGYGNRPHSINVTPTPVNVNQMILPMPESQLATSNSLGTQLLQLKGQINNLNQTVSAQNQTINTLQTSLSQQIALTNLALSSLSAQVSKLIV